MGVSGSDAPRRGEGWRLWVRLVLAGGVLVGAWWLAEGVLGGSSAQAHDCVDRYGSGAFSYGEAEGANSGHGHFCGVRSTTPTTPTTAPPSNGGVSDPESLTPIDRSGQHSAPHGYWHANHADRSHCGDGDHYYHDRYTRARSCGGASSGSDACVSDRHRHTYSGSWCHPDHTAANGDCRTHRANGTHEANPCPDDSADDDDDDDACVSGRHEHTYSGSWCHLDHTEANGDCRTHRDDGTHEANPCPDDADDDGGGGGCSVALGALGAGTVTRSGTWAAGCTSDNRGSAQVPYRAVRYTFSVAGAATATVGVSSSTDAYVYLTNADRSLSRHDNNSGAHSGDALLSAVTLAAAGYTVEATTAAPRQDGAFTMTLTIADAPDPPPDVVISGLADASATPAAGAATAAASDTFGVTPAGAACSATPPGAAVAPAAGTSRTVTHTVAAGTTVTVTVTCMTSTSTASADARFTADAAPVPDVEIDGLDHASATPDTDSTSAEVTDTFGVTPAAARCSAQATPGTPQVAPATGTSRTVTLDVAAGTTVWVIVICNHRTNRDLAATRFTAHPAPTNTDTDTDTDTTPPAATPTPPTATTTPANSDDCDTPLGALTAATPPTTGTLAATDGCTSTRHPRKTATSTYQARRHTFTLNSPGWVTITLESAATNTQRIDTYLVLLRGHTPDGTGTYITHNDDAQNAAAHGLHWRDSRLVDVFLRPGSYTIEATTYHAHSTNNPARTTGDYDLTVVAVGGAGAACTDDLGTLAAGRYVRTGTVAVVQGCTSSHRGSGTSRPSARWHTFTLDAPAWVDIDLAKANSSSPLDPYLLLLLGHASTGTVLEQDNNSGTATAAQIHGRYLQAGTYTIETTAATHIGVASTGDYTLTVTVPIHGLPQQIDATVDQQTTVNFNYWPTNARIAAESQELAVASSGSGGSHSMMVAPDRARSHTVSVHMNSSTAPRSGTAGAARGATARSSHQAGTTRTFPATVTSSCPTGKVQSPINQVLCVTPSQEALPQHLDQQPDQENRSLYQGPYYVTPGALLGTRDAAQRAIDRRGSGCGMAVLELTALMLAIGYWENPNNWQDVVRDGEIVDYENQRFPARSLMTLSRRDHEWTPVGSGEDNTRLYSFNSLTAAPSRAFWHPGVGMWQIDKFGSHDLNHGQRADTAGGGERVAKTLLEQSCALSESDFEWWLEGTWGGCKPGDTDAERRAARSQCLNSKNGLYMASWSTSSREDLYVRVTPENRFHTSRTGGVYPSLPCRLRDDAAIDNIEDGCYFYDTDNPEGFAADHEPKSGHTSKGADEDWKAKDSPYAVPFVSFTNEFEDGRMVRFAVFPQSFMDGHTSTLIKTVPAPSAAVRVYSGTDLNPSWQTDTYNGWRVEVHLCRGAVASFAPDCAWLDVNAAGSEPNRFVDWIARIRAQHR
ncbi:hypothetical protein [Candidatus Poriferisodalis sp.]|uniref:hypothetical protein n=1 Tax=Candidatus Poriferisodalis sp. TaxID=3101277 RepID=UPI003AF6996E